MFLLILCSILAILGLLTVIAFYAALIVMQFTVDQEREERLRIEHETLRAQRRLHAITTNAFEQMLDAARERRRREQ